MVDDIVKLAEHIYQVEVRKRSDDMFKLEFTKEEVKEIKSKIYLTELQEKIFDLKMEGNLTEYGIALEVNKSESTVSYQWRKVKDKILKVI